LPVVVATDIIDMVVLETGLLVQNIDGSVRVTTFFPADDLAPAWTFRVVPWLNNAKSMRGDSVLDAVVSRGADDILRYGRQVLPPELQDAVDIPPGRGSPVEYWGVMSDGTVRCMAYPFVYGGPWRDCSSSIRQPLANLERLRMY